MSQQPITAVIDLDLPGPTISRHIYGHFAEHLGRCIYGGFWVGEDSDVPNVRGIRKDVVEALRDLRIPNLRWPGGCFADEYHWRDGIGPRQSRPRMVNSHWGDVVEDNSFGTHEFMDLCGMLGADAYICGNVGSGSVREMSEWIEYLTRDDDSPMAALRRANGRDAAWKVPFWGIGNEPWGCGGHFSAEQYAAAALQYSTYVRNHNGNRVYRVAAGANQSDYHWTETLMRSLGDLTADSGRPQIFQAISLHGYTYTEGRKRRGAATGFPVEDYYAVLASATGIGEVVGRHATLMNHYDPLRKIGLVVDEWGSWYDVEPGTNPRFLYQQNTIRDALVAALHFDTFHKHADRVVMANIAQTVNVLQAMILTDEKTNELILTPTYHVFAMNVGHHDARALDVHLRDVPSIEMAGRDVPSFSASASTKDGTALVSLSNLHASADQAVRLDLRGREVRDPHGRILTGPDLDSHNTTIEPGAVRPAGFDAIELASSGVLTMTIPAHSYLTVSVNLV